MSTTHTPRIAVVGSLNMDLVLQVQHAPGPGETVLADALHLVPGGKGGNQAVACARQGARVALFGRVGDDGYGHTLRTGLDADGIDHSGVQTDTETTTGVAAITVEATGQNRIVVVPGANGRFVLDAAALGAALQGAGGLVLQFETPLPQVLAAAEMAQAGAALVLVTHDEALARMLQDELFSQELANNPEFAHLARGRPRTVGGRPTNQAALVGEPPVRHGGAKRTGDDGSNFMEKVAGA